MSVKGIMREYGGGIPQGLAEEIARFRVAGSDVVEDTKTTTAPGDPVVPDLHPRPTGQEIFDAKTKDEQDAMLGPEAAAKVRDGELALHDLVDHVALDGDTPNFITQKPLDAAQ